MKAQMNLMNMQKDLMSEMVGGVECHEYFSERPPSTATRCMNGSHYIPILPLVLELDVNNFADATYTIYLYSQVLILFL